MQDPDPLDDRLRDGLARTEAEVAKLAAELSAEQPAETETVRNEPIDHGILDSDFMKEFGSGVVGLIAEALKGFASRPRVPRESRFTNRARAVVSVPPPVMATAPAPVPAPNVAPGKPAAPTE